MSSIIQVYSGKGFDPLNPVEEGIDIKDIARALSNICRYNGHVKYFYSVAQHSVLVSQMVPPEDALWALLHDATEAYLSDIPFPVKKVFPDFIAAEDRLMVVIARKFGLPEVMPQSVRQADMAIRAVEKEAVLPPAKFEWPGLKDIPHPGIKIGGYWSPDTACRFFLHRFQELTSQRDRRSGVAVKSSPKKVVKKAAKKAAKKK